MCKHLPLRLQASHQQQDRRELRLFAKSVNIKLIRTMMMINIGVGLVAMGLRLKLASLALIWLGCKVSCTCSSAPPRRIRSDKLGPDRTTTTPEEGFLQQPSTVVRTLSEPLFQHVTQLEPCPLQAAQEWPGQGPGAKANFAGFMPL